MSENMKFYLYIVEEYAHQKNIPGPVVLTLFSSSGADKYIKENANVLHTCGANWLINDIDGFISDAQGGLPQNA